jgi:hypothetical protein
MRKILNIVALATVLCLPCSIASAKFSEGYDGSANAGAFDVAPETTTPKAADPIKSVTDKIAAAAAKAPAPVAAVPARQVNSNPQGCANGQCGRSR